MKKQLIALAAATTLIASSLVGCGSSGDTAKTDSQPETAEETTAEETEETEEAVEEAAAEEAEAGGITDEEVTLRFMWWGSDARHEATLAVIEQYEALHPNVTIEGEYGGFDGYFEKLTTQLAGGTAPDIIQYNADFITDLMAIGDVFVNLEDYSDYLDVSGFDQNFLDIYSYWDGKMISLPTGVNGSIFLTNTAVLEKSGYTVDDIKTWDDFIAAGKALHEADPDSYLWNIDIYTLGTDVFGGMITQLIGDDAYNADEKKLNFDRDDLLKVFTVFEELYENDVVEPAADSAPYELEIATNPKWINDQFAMCYGVTSNIYEGYYDFQDTADVLPMPQFEGAKESGVIYRPPQLMAIASNSEHPEVAADFLNYFYNNEEAIKTLKSVRSMQPTAKGQEICAENGDLDPVLVKAIEEAAQTATVHQNLNTPSEMAEIIQDAVEKIAYGQGDVETITDDTMALLEEAISRQ